MTDKPHDYNNLNYDDLLKIIAHQDKVIMESSGAAVLSQYMAANADLQKLVNDLARDRDHYREQARPNLRMLGEQTKEIGELRAMVEQLNKRLADMVNEMQGPRETPYVREVRRIKDAAIAHEVGEREKYKKLWRHEQNRSEMLKRMIDAISEYPYIDTLLREFCTDETRRKENAEAPIVSKTFDQH